MLPVRFHYFIFHTFTPTTKAPMSPIFVYVKPNNAEAEGDNFP